MPESRPEHNAGALYDVYAPSQKASKPASEWNQTEISIIGNTIEHKLNGKQVVKAELGSEDWKVRIAKSKWKSAARYAAIGAARGHIVLQYHGDPVEFRNVKIRVLNGVKAAVPARK
jgi:hypothetical protein